MNVNITGVYHDVYLYMNYLFCVNSNYELEVVDWRSWLENFFENYRSDKWIEARLLGDRSSNRKVSDGSLDLGRIPEKHIVQRMSLGIESFVDWLVYNRTIYFASSSGVFMLPILIDDTYRGAFFPTAQRFIEERPLQLRAKMGVVAVACGYHGLHARQAYLWDDQRVPFVRPRKIDTVQADRTSWMEHSLLTIAPSTASLVENSVTSADFGENSDEQEKNSIAELATDVKPASQLFKKRKTTFEAGFASNSFLYAWQGARVLRYKLNRKLAVFGERDPCEFPVAQIYNGQSFRLGLLFDTDVGTVYTSALRLNPIILSIGENVVVRAFNQSRYYTQQVWSVKGEARVEVSLLDPD